MRALKFFRNTVLFTAVLCLFAAAASAEISMQDLEDCAGDLPDLLEQIESGALDVNTRDGEGRAPLHCAIFADDVAAVETLLSHGADVRAELKVAEYYEDEHPMPVTVQPIFLAVEQGNTEIVSLLLNKGVSVNEVTDTYGLTPLHVAAELGRLDMADMLLDRGARINAFSDDGTPLHAAVFHGQRDMVKLLLERGAKVDSKFADSTPLIFAAFSDETAIAEILLDAGANIDQRDFEGKTALFNAVEEGYVEMVALLLRRGAKPFIESKMGATPLEEAKRRGHQDVADLLTGFQKTGKVPGGEIRGMGIDTPQEHIMYPELRDGDDPSLFGRINTLITDLVEKIRTYMEPDEEMGAPSVYVDYSVELHTMNLLSILFHASYMYEGTAHPSNILFSLTADLSDGAVYDFRDIFRPDCDPVATLTPLIQEFLANNDVLIFEDEFTGFELDPADEYAAPGFFLSGSNVAIYFQEYIYTPHAYGPLVVMIPRSKLADCLDEKFAP